MAAVVAEASSVEGGEYAVVIIVYRAEAATD